MTTRLLRLEADLRRAARAYCAALADYRESLPGIQRRQAMEALDDRMVELHDAARTLGRYAAKMADACAVAKVVK